MPSIVKINRNSKSNRPMYIEFLRVDEITLIMTLMYFRDLIRRVTLRTLNTLSDLNAVNPLPVARKYSISPRVTRKASNMFSLSRT